MAAAAILDQPWGGDFLPPPQGGDLRRNCEDRHDRSGHPFARTRMGPFDRTRMGPSTWKHSQTRGAQPGILTCDAYRGTSLIRERAPPRTTGHCPDVGSQGGAVSYERGTPVRWQGGDIRRRGADQQDRPRDPLSGLFHLISRPHQINYALTNVYYAQGGDLRRRGAHQQDRPRDPPARTRTGPLD